MPHSEPQENGRELGKSRHEKINQRDVDNQLELEAEDSPVPCSASHSSSQSLKEVISFAPDDPDNPHNWSSKKKSFVVFTGVALVMSSTIGSSISAGASQEFATYFHITNQEQLVLPTSIYLVGYVLGPLAFGPLSESYGRKWVMVSTFVRGLPCLENGSMAFLMLPHTGAIHRLHVGLCIST